MTLDPRLTPARPDLAAAHLRGVVDAARFIEGERWRVRAVSAPVRREPSPEAPLTTEALSGETVTVYETTPEGWAWGQLEADLYVGWLPVEALAAPGAPVTHKVAALRTPVFPGPSIKLPPRELLSFGSRVGVVEMRERFAVTQDGGFLFAGHLVPLDAVEEDFVAVAARFLGAAYLWGGRSSLGLDCSGLVQVSLAAAGIAAPRDSDMQERALGAPVAFEGDIAVLERGDLVFWPGHVGIVEDRGTLLHATAAFMSVVREPLAGALARIAAASAPVRSVRRLG
ncbi:C40 family peptidase [Ancylobacter amanitiformis]|uniref:Cell wall-associated NlpC family hydrolase n=1 Tax=Ancylobacter amanitiformis TaxID=217069 RepID=A0ABU0LUQ7_9HYPH|nr:NlpC/P60 family protein [Ancylobacter amanitiformis]MDQ0512436.1 cell wall-associated NlpC family hydrolase [Ancylobacter amanitiformis]